MVGEDYKEWLKYVLDWRNLWLVLLVGIGPSKDGLPPKQGRCFKVSALSNEQELLSWNLLECHAVSTGEYLPTFRRKVVGSSSRSSNPKSVALTSKMRALWSLEKSTPVHHQSLQSQTLWTAEEHVDYRRTLEDLRTITRHSYVYAYTYISLCMRIRAWVNV
jgi:hypothetical protein